VLGRTNVRNIFSSHFRQSNCGQGQISDEARSENEQTCEERNKQAASKALAETGLPSTSAVHFLMSTLILVSTAKKKLSFLL
jgi:hypothetical protein